MSSQIDGYNTDKIWKEIVVLFRRLCFMRRTGQSEAASQTLRKDLLDKIARWSRAASEPFEAKRTRLARMFKEEQRRVADACTLQELSLEQRQQDMVPLITRRIAQEIQTIVASQLEAQAARQQQLGREIETLAGQFEQESAHRAAQETVLQTVQKTVEDAIKKLPKAPARIPFDDIPSIIDQINDEERRTHSARRKFAVMPPPSDASYRSGPVGTVGDNPRDATSREVQEAVA
jgi:hypothetical protein